MGISDGSHHERSRRCDLRTEERGSSENLVDDRDQHRGFQILSWDPGHARPRNQCPAADRPRCHYHHEMGTRGWLFRGRPGCGDLPRRTGSPFDQPDGGFQLSGLVQLRRGREAAVLGLLHQLGRGHYGLDSRPGKDRRHALQVGLGNRKQPFSDPVFEGTTLRRRYRFRAGIVHERI